MGSMKIPKETLKWFGGDELRARVFYEKYALRDYEGRVMEKTPPEMWRRVAREISSVEKDEKKRKEWEEKFYWLLENFRFVPGGRIMFGAGNPRKATLLNCYYLPIKEDSIEGIFECAKEMARTYSYGGGVGIDITPLRPRGSPVANSAIFSTGAVSFMDLFSKVTGTIGQSGRRGALMITIEDRHPDVFDFIDVKDDPLRINVRYANISVKVSDELVKAVKEDGLFTLWFENERVKRIEHKVRARDLWSRLVKRAWSSAEPGVIFWSTAKRFSPTEYDDKMAVKGVNPCSEQVLEDYGCCFAKGTKILTSRGLENVEELYERQRYEDVFVATQLNPDGTPSDFITFRPAFVFHMGEREIWEVELVNGLSIKLTADHEVLVERDGKLMWVQVMDLTENDKILVQIATPSLRFESSEEDIKLYHLFGWLVGDGWLTEKKTFGITFGPKDNFAREYLTPVWREFTEVQGKGEQVQANGVRVLTSQKKSVKQKLIELGFKEARGPEKRVPECVWKAPDDLQIAFLQGLFSADGTHGNGSHKKIVSLSSSSLGLLKDVQLLLSKFGIQSTLRWTKIRKKGKSQGRLDITRESYVKFMRMIGFPLTPYKNKIREEGKKYKDLRAIKIKAIKYAGVDDVYDVTEPVTHSLIANGMIVHNCNLGNINLSLFVKNPFGKKPDVEKFWDIFEKKGIRAAMEYAEKRRWAYPDLELLERAVRFGMRFLDDVLDYSADRHPLPEQREASLYTRRTGLGATGLADMLAKMRIKYDTEEAVFMMDKLFEFIKNTAYDESSDISKEKGSFPAFQREKHLDQPFLKGVSEAIREKIWMQGLRNACLLTIPPVGSGAVLAGTTGGIEPIFALSYIRRSESLSKEFFKVYHPLVGMYLELFGGKDETDLPDFFVTAHQIEPKMRVKIQGVIQRHIDSSISSTVNLPKNTTPEEIGMIYELAWEMGCKGITVYREGSREGVLITEEEAKQKLTKDEDGEVPKVELSDVCPECSSTLIKTNSHLVCRGCGLTF